MPHVLVQVARAMPEALNRNSRFLRALAMLPCEPDIEGRDVLTYALQGGWRVNLCAPLLELLLTHGGAGATVAIHQVLVGFTLSAQLTQQCGFTESQAALLRLFSP